MKNIILTVCVLLGIYSHVSVPSVFAQTATPVPTAAPSAPPSPCANDKDISTDVGCIPTNPVGFVEKFYGLGLSLIGGLAVLFIIYGGYNILASQGNPEMLAKGKSYILYAVIGLLLAIFGYVFIKFVAVDFLHIPGFG